MSFFTELKRRNVIRVGAAYIVTAWLIIQVVETIFPAFGFGDAAVRISTIVLAIGLAPTLILAWAFEWTPEGLKKEKDVDRTSPVSLTAGKRLDRIILVVLALALGYFAFDKFVWSPQRQAQELATATQEARQAGRTEALVESYGDKSIAVLPFVNLSSDPEQEYFSDGISEELLNLLAQIPELRVISRSSSFSFKGKNVTIPEVAKQLQVEHVLEGSIRKAGDRVRITVQLIEARSDRHLWSEVYDRELDDIFAIQEEIASSIGSALESTLVKGGTASVHPRASETTNKAAYDAYLRGRDLINQRGRDNSQAAVGHLKRALRLDENFAPAHAQLAIATILYTGYSEEDRQFAISHLDRAQQLEPDLAEAHAGRAMLAIHDEDYEAAVGYAHKALSVNPNYIDAMRWLGIALSGLGRKQEAEAVREQVLVIDPLSVVGRLSHAENLASQGRFDEAHELADQLLEDSPWAGYRAHIHTYLWKEGKLAEALYWALKAGDDFNVMAIFQFVHEFGEARRIDHDASFWLDVEEKNWDAAVSSAKKETQLHPDDRNYVADELEILFLAGRFGETLPLYEGLFDLAPEGELMPVYWNPLGQTMRLAFARRMAGDEEGAQAVAEIVRRKLLDERESTSEFRWLLDVAEAMIAAFDHDKDHAIAAMQSAIRNGLRTRVYIDDPFFEDLSADQRWKALRQDLVAILAEERDKILQLICFNNPVPEDWQPMPETCAGVEEQRP